MCIAFMSISDDPRKDGYKVIIAANRDEFYNRPTKELDWWDDSPDVISGVDLFPGKEGGTWLGMTKTGKIGILTNYRQSEKFRIQNGKGRGHLVSDFLKSEEKPRTFLENVEKHGSEYDGFNLILGNVCPENSEINFSYFCNKEQQPLKDMKAGIYGLSNRYLDYGWKKIVSGKERFEKIVKGDMKIQEKIENVLELLHDKARYGIDDVFRGPEDEGLPDNFLEALSAISVNIPEVKYGTRTNSIIVIDDEDNATFFERTMVEPVNLKNPAWKVNSFKFKIEPQIHS